MFAPATEGAGSVKTGIQKNTGCRIMSGMTGVGYFVAGLIISHVAGVLVKGKGAI
jgi:hypothetical protein